VERRRRVQGRIQETTTGTVPRKRSRILATKARPLPRNDNPTTRGNATGKVAARTKESDGMETTGARGTRRVMETREGRRTGTRAYLHRCACTTLKQTVRNPSSVRVQLVYLHVLVGRRRRGGKTTTPSPGRCSGTRTVVSETRKGRPRPCTPGASLVLRPSFPPDPASALAFICRCRNEKRRPSTLLLPLRPRWPRPTPWPRHEGPP